MSQPKICLACKNQIQSTWKFCLECGARVDHSVIDETGAIDYLLAQIGNWRDDKLIDSRVEQELIERYQSRKSFLIDAIRPQPKQFTQPTANANPSATFVVKTPQPAAPSNAENVDSQSGNNNQPPIPNNIPLSQPPITQAPLSQPPLAIAANGGNNAGNGGYNRGNQPQPNMPMPSMPIAEPRTIAEQVIENIRIIFAISAALFVGGVLLYYRNEIYHGLSKPIVQAAILILMTLATLITGITLVRRTEQSLAGRTLTLVGALLVPINPWFLVRSHLIADTGNAWVLGLACTGLYASITYFLRDRLFVYISLVTAIISSWALVYKFSDGSASIYAVTLMACSIAALLAERAFKPAGDSVVFSREEFGRPFFHVAQTGIVICLLFYTPLMELLPAEFIAAKEHFDPHSYNSLVTVWLSLAAAFAYGYSAVIRRAEYFAYLAIVAFCWSEGSLLSHLNADLQTTALSFAITALAFQIAAQFFQLDQLFAQPLNRSALVINWGFFLWAVCALLPMLVGAKLVFSWRVLLAFYVAAITFILELIRSKRGENLLAAATLLTNSGLFLMVKFQVAAPVILLIMPLPAFIAVGLMRYWQNSEWQGLKNYLHAVALSTAFGVTIGAMAHIDTYADSEFAKIVWPIEIAAIFTLLNYHHTSRFYQIATSLLAGCYLMFSYAFFSHLIIDKRFDNRHYLTAYALLALGYLALSRLEKLGDSMRLALSLLSSSVTVMVMLISLLITVDEHTMIDRSWPVILALVLVSVKAIWHLYLSRNAYHATFAGLTGLSFTLALLHFDGYEPYLQTYVAVYTLVAAGYLVLARSWRVNNHNKALYLPFELIAQIVVGWNMLVALALCFDRLKLSVVMATALIGGFYLLAAGARKHGGYLYPALFAACVGSWQLFSYYQIGGEYYLIFYALGGLGLMLFSEKSDAVVAWATDALTKSAQLLFYSAAIVAVVRCVAELSLNNVELNGWIFTLLAITIISVLMSALSNKTEIRQFHRYTSFILSNITYLAVGIRLGYDLIDAAEFYAIPIGAALLFAGYWSLRKQSDPATHQLGATWLVFGSLLWAMPLLLHALQYRFMINVSSNRHDIGVLIVSLALVLGGIMLQLKAPTIIGGATFLIELSVIVFSFVEWEQQWLSISMILLAVIVFVTTWLIYVFAKRNQLTRINEQGKAIIEEFGKWK